MVAQASSVVRAAGQVVVLLLTGAFESGRAYEVTVTSRNSAAASPKAATAVVNLPLPPPPPPPPSPPSPLLRGSPASFAAETEEGALSPLLDASMGSVEGRALEAWEAGGSDGGEDDGEDGGGVDRDPA